MLLRLVVFLSAGDDQTHSKAFVYNKASTLQVLQWFPTLKTEHWIHSPGILKYRNEILPYNMFPSDVPGASLNLRLEILKLQGLFNGVFPYLRVVNYVVCDCDCVSIL